MEEASEPRGSVCSILKRAKLPPPNLHKDRTIALKILRQDIGITILPADKGNAAVVLDLTEYEEKVRNLLEEKVYKKVTETQQLPMQTRANKVLTEFIKLKAQYLIPKELARTLKTTSAVPPKLYALPKIHKPGVPVRPIVSSISSPIYQLAKIHMYMYITALINPLTGHTS